MRFFTILKSMIQAISKKQNANWVNLGTTQTGTIRFNLANYTEVIIEVSFGGVLMSQSIPVKRLNDTGTILVPGWYATKNIYVNISKTRALIDTHPVGYTANLQVYAR